MSSLGAVLLLVAGIVLVVGGAELFFDGLLAVASRLRVSAYALTVLVSGLELENLAAGIAANAKGLPGAAAGTFLGGTTFLALGVVGVGALIAPIRAELPRAAVAWLAAAPLPLAALSADGELSRLDGAILIGWFCIALISLARASPSPVSEGDDAGERSAERAVGGAAAASAGERRSWPISRLLAGLTVLTVGGVVLADGIRRVVRDLGVSQTLLGNTAIAAGVEAEEVARVAVPARRGRGDVALANVGGTIVHFTALNAGVIALVRPLHLDSASLHLHLPASVLATLLLAGVLLLGRGFGRATGAGFVALYLAYVGAAIAVG
jgi:cation:H+ antiporter